jgi:hypothetical protein
MIVVKTTFNLFTTPTSTCVSRPMEKLTHLDKHWHDDQHKNYVSCHYDNPMVNVWCLFPLPHVIIWLPFHYSIWQVDNLTIGKKVIKMYVKIMPSFSYQNPLVSHFNWFRFHFPSSRLSPNPTYNAFYQIFILDKDLQRSCSENLGPTPASNQLLIPRAAPFLVLTLHIILA